MTTTMILSKMKLLAGMLLVAGLVGMLLGTNPLAPPAPGADQAAPQAPAEKAQPAADKNDDTKEVELVGRVLDPEGQPLAGAKLYAWADGMKKRDDRLAGGVTAADGRFRFRLDRSQLARNAKLLASAPGFGPDWVELRQAKLDDLTLRLPKDDIPVEGRVLDLEGKPVADVPVEITHVGKPLGDADLQGWVDKIVRIHEQGDWRSNRPPLTTMTPAALGLPATATTDTDGRFRITGVGRERVVTVNLRGETTEHIQVRALTRVLQPAAVIQGHLGLYGATFEVLPGPSRSFVGTVRDKKTGQPIAGVTVADSYRFMALATTDAKGQFRLVGAVKRSAYAIAVAGKKGVPYLDFTRFDIPDTPGLDALTVDFEMERGVEVSGRVTDAAGKPVQGEVWYFHAFDNPNLKDFTTVGRVMEVVNPRGRIGRDGTFTVLALPGPGVLVVCAAEADQYLRLDTVRELSKLKVSAFPDVPVHAAVPIDVREADPKSLVCDIILKPGRKDEGGATRPDSKP